MPTVTRLHTALSRSNDGEIAGAVQPRYPDAQGRRSGDLMERFDSSGVLPDHLRGGVAALGNFDGFHLGHQAVVARAVALARERGVPALVVTFDPHPARLFRPDAPPFSLTTVDQRLCLFAGAGVDAATVLRFDRAFAEVTAQGFISDWLQTKLGLSGVVTGDDFTFGKGRGGSVGVLAVDGPEHGFTAETVAPICARDGSIVSSTRIREALQAADPQTAAQLLTRPFTIEGVVEHGDKRGRTIDFPTANLALGPYVRPAYGVYAVRVRLADGSRIDGVANLGVRPMFAPPKELLETYLFDWSGDLYRQTIGVELHHFIRPEWKLDGLGALKSQIAKDCAEARRLLSA